MPSERTTELLVRGIAAFRVGKALSFMVDPRFWFSRRIGALSDEPSFERRRDAAAFRLDMLSQVVRDKPLLRSRWQRAFRDSTPGTVEPLPEIEWTGDLEAFRTQFRDPMQPCVIRGILDQDPEYRRWDLGDLIARYGDEQVTLTCPVRDGYRGKLRELDIPGVYLHNSEVLLRRHPELLRQAGFGIVPEVTAGLRFAGVAQLFAGHARTGSWWHCASGHNFFLQLAGRKRWTFIRAVHTPWVHPRTNGNARGVYYWSEAGPSSPVFKDAAALAEAEVCPTEAWLLEAIAHPPRLEVVLEPGDVLYNPPFTWHQVENLDPSTIGMATRWFDPNDRRFPVDVYNVGECLAVTASNEMARSILGQRLVDAEGRIDYDAFQAQLDEGVRTSRTRSRQTEHLVTDADVAAYYARFDAAEATS